MSEMEAVEITTSAIRETGVYTGPRIPGTSGDIVGVEIAKEYSFTDGITVRVSDIPARLDRATGKIYISGRDGKRLLGIVEKYRDTLRSQRRQSIAPLRHARFGIHVSAAEPKAA